MKLALFLFSLFRHFFRFGERVDNTPNPGVNAVQYHILDASSGEALTEVQITNETRTILFGQMNPAFHIGAYIGQTVYFYPLASLLPYPHFRNCNH